MYVCVYPVCLWSGENKVDIFSEKLEKQRFLREDVVP